MTKLRNTRCRAAAIAGAALLAWVWPAPPSPAQPAAITRASHFDLSEFYDPPFQSQMKWRITGAEARPLPNRRYQIEQAKLEMFRTNGQAEIALSAPECIYDANLKQVSSPGHLQAMTGDGQFFVEGLGFLWQQTNANLAISNQAHTILQQDVLTPQPGARRATAPPPEAQTTDIFSDRFDYDNPSGVAIYRGNARVVGTNLALSGDALTIKLSLQKHEVERITTEQDVTFDHQGIHGTGQRLVYAPADNLVRLSGQPAWSAAGREGHGDELVLDRSNSVLRVRGQACLKIPGANLGTRGFLPAPTPRQAGPAVTTNRCVEIRSDTYEIRTNRAVFDGGVQASDLAGDQQFGQLRCGRMTVAFAGTNEIQGFVAEENVLLVQEGPGGFRLTGDRAVYAGDDDVLDLTGNPAWQAGQRQGKGDLVRVRGRDGEIEVRTNAFLRLPAGEIVRFTATATNPPGTTAAAPAPEQFARILCDGYTLKSDDAVFRGAVRVEHPQMRLACETFTAQQSADEPRRQSFVADHLGFVDLTDEKGQRTHGTGDRLRYSCVTSATATNELVQLMGPRSTLLQENDQGTLLLTGDLITLDRVANKVRAVENYKMRFTPKPAGGKNPSPGLTDKPGT